MSKVLTMCPGCTSKIRVPDKYLGQKISCPKCQGTVLVQDIEAAETEPEELPRPVAKAPAKPVARSAPPPIPRAVAPAAKAAPPARPRKPAPVEVIDDFEEVPDDDLFERGAQSLDLVWMIGAIHERHGVELTFIDLLDNATPRDLARLVAARRGQQADS